MTPAPGNCEWTWGRGTKRYPFVQCKNPAAWQHENERRLTATFWRLCDEHKNLVLESYNETWRAKEEPEWKRIASAASEARRGDDHGQ